MIAEFEKVLASVGPGHPRTLVEEAYAAAESYLDSRVAWPGQGPEGDSQSAPAPAALVQAVKLLTARYLARRNSPDGLVGLGDLGVARIAATDQDVQRLMAPWRKVVLA